MTMFCNRAARCLAALTAVPLLTVPCAGREAETRRDVLARVGRAARLTLLCDRRVAGLTVYRRAAPGAMLAATDLLQAVCLSVGGMFRKIERRGGAEPMYLLTNDREGIATRLLRWSDWAETPVNCPRSCKKRRGRRWTTG